MLGIVAVLVAAAPARAEPTGRLLATLDDGGTPRAMFAQTGVRPSGPRVPQIGLVTVRPAPGISAATALRRLRADPRVRRAVPEGRFTLRYTPSDRALTATDPAPGAPPGTPLQWAAERQGLFRAWDVTRGEEALVGVIDTGVDGGHPDLAGKVADAIDLDESTDSPATADADGHGTHVASLACAATDNGIGIAGAGFGCRLLVLKSDLTDASVAQAIVTAADRGAHALNMSFGDEGRDPSPVIADAVAYAVERGVVLVAAAADQPVEEQGEPANLLQPAGTGSNLAEGDGLSVTAAAIDDARAPFAGRGDQISLAATAR